MALSTIPRRPAGGLGLQDPGNASNGDDTDGVELRSSEVQDGAPATGQSMPLAPPPPSPQRPAGGGCLCLGPPGSPLHSSSPSPGLAFPLLSSANQSLGSMDVVLLDDSTSTTTGDRNIPITATDNSATPDATSSSTSSSRTGSSTGAAAATAVGNAVRPAALRVTVRLSSHYHFASPASASASGGGGGAGDRPTLLVAASLQHRQHQQQSDAGEDDGGAAASCPHTGSGNWWSVRGSPPGNEPGAAGTVSLDVSSLAPNCSDPWDSSQSRLLSVFAQVEVGVEVGAQSSTNTAGIQTGWGGDSPLTTCLPPARYAAVQMYCCACLPPPLPPPQPPDPPGVGA
ncbi:hypothetical protein PLESTF_000789600 [Pleodorina starrii]|nr:hypothetical protein PLESTF_000789600 [Pleodorina starrii]